MPMRRVPTPHLGGKLAVALFILALLAFVIESQLTQYVQTTLGYRQPFFLFYLVHSSFSIIFPLHFLYLTSVTNYSASSLLNGLSIAIVNHLSPYERSGSTKFPLGRFAQLVLALSVGITCPSLLWFAAISLASISDVTAIWNTNAIFAYVITVKLFGLKWEPRRLLAVLLATLGVMAVVYGGSTSDNGQPSTEEMSKDVNVISVEPSAPLVGDLLTLIASLGYGLYQVLYKKYAALPTDPEAVSDPLYEQISNDGSTSVYDEFDAADHSHVANPPPFGLHANLMTSIIGLVTFAVLWIPIPILHYLDIEPFVLPANSKTVLAIAGIALSGVVFNAGFMVLLGTWGPIITSVGNLLTIVLVLVSDMVFGAGPEALTMWSLVGCSVIVAAFSVLAYDMFTRGS
ncbi:hypothetical protein Hypma_015545 [Hypsizygus marmoreus]|uniref:EamA domain-containing protein n=1 Tax=Hypsizygus marmoreus TaxID=39966 RepID=A0A369K3U8_HYPMA|nr:hypothetical protein Hypma_015545 [Hypsizygus marmoreus]